MHDEIVATVLADQIPYLEGPPGCGKTAISKILAQKMNARLFIVYLAQRAGNEIHGIPVVRKETLSLGGREYSVIEQAPPDYAVQAAQDAEQGAFSWILFDEFNQLSPSDVGQAMSILTERVIGGVALDRRSIGIIATGNPPELSAGGWHFPPAATRRVVKFRFELSAEAFAAVNAFPSNWGYPLPEIEKFGKKLETALRWKKRQEIAAFVRKSPAIFELPKDLSKLEGGFACPATMEDAADLLASIEQHVPEERWERIKTLVLSGKIGIAAASEFMTFTSSLNAPDAGEALDNVAAFAKSSLPAELASRQDLLYFFILNVASLVRQAAAAAGNSKAGRDRAGKRFTAALHIANALFDANCPSDLLCMLVAAVAQSGARPTGVPLPGIVDKLGGLAQVVKDAEINWATFVPLG